MNVSFAPRGHRPVSVGLVEDHAMFREGIRLVLENAEGIEVVGDADAPAGAFDLVERAAPDVLLLDLSLGESNGMSLLRAMVDRHPSTRVLIVSMYRHAEMVRQALAAGAAGYIVKSARGTELVDAIHAVARGDQYVHSSVVGAIVEDSLRWQRSGEVITAREREIVIMVGAGKQAPQIARQLGISEHTVRRHIANVTEKLGIRGISGLREYVAQHGLLLERSLGADA